ncbi:MAG: DUF1643 domain-containing protein [Kiloniellaceae bacterium]
MTGDLFDLPPAARPLPRDMVRRAEISPCGRYRFSLERTWHAGKFVCFIGLNPSTADALRDDPTVRRWVHFAHAWGYGGFAAVNLYPFRASAPQACEAWDKAARRDDGPETDAAMKANAVVVSEVAARAARVVACWGGALWDPAHADRVLAALKRGGVEKVYCLGKTQDGAPKHPMARGEHRVPDDQKPLLWRTL